MDHDSNSSGHTYLSSLTRVPGSGFSSHEFHGFCLL
jgi:hypothetical protein